MSESQKRSDFFNPKSLSGRKVLLLCTLVALLAVADRESHWWMIPVWAFLLASSAVVFWCALSRKPLAVNDMLTSIPV